MPYKKREKQLEAYKRYREKRNKDLKRYRAYREHQKEWEKNNYVKRRWSSKKSHAKRKGVIFELEKEWFISWWKSQPGFCFYCGAIPGKKGDMELDRKISELGYVADNIVLACMGCNRAKGDVFTSEEWSQIVKEYNLKERYNIK